MAYDLATLAAEQRQFLAALAAAGKPVPAKLAEKLCPIQPGSILTLLAGEGAPGWVRKTTDRRYSLAAEIPAGTLAAIQAANTDKRFSQLAERLQPGDPTGREQIHLWSDLMERAGRTPEAIRHQVDLARQAMNNDNVEAAQDVLALTADRLSNLSEDAGPDRLFTSVALEFSSRAYARGKGPGKALLILKQAARAAQRIGDRRSLALSRLHMGRLLHVSGQHTRALAALQAGLDLVEALGDVDIRIESAAFIGTYYYIQGMYRDAVEHLERALHTFESGKTGISWDPSAPVLFGYCSAYLGWFHRSIGCLDCNFRLARRRTDRGLAATLQAALGSVLVLTGNQASARFHLEAALDEAGTASNDLAMYLAHGGLAFSLYSQGHLQKAFEMMTRAASMGIEAGFDHHYSSPWILEMLFDFARQGFQIPGFSFTGELARIMNRSNVHLKGVGLRLKAAGTDPENDTQRPLSDLSASIDLLKRAGDPVQLAKSRLALSRLKSKAGLKAEADALAEKARQGTAALPWSVFTGDTGRLVPQKETARTKARSPALIEKALEMLGELASVEAQDELLPRTVKTACNLLNAERGGFFQPADQTAGKPELVAACHLTVGEIKGEHFRPNLELIQRALTGKQPLMRRFGDYGHTRQGVKAAICLPLTRKRHPTKGVLYLDATHLADHFLLPDPAAATRLAQHISVCLDLLTEYGRLKNERSLLSSEKTLMAESLKREEIICRDTLMTDLLSRADQVADSNLTVLILGETGVGKELMARRLHKMSPRKAKPYVVVDLTGIPETLLESELFGHEKGAFTGADRQKRGRLELAHQGTLFFDEIGEISPAIQIKLLRTLQEKAFVRVGGMRTIHSDFRLVAATNRDLEKEVAAGRFRQDLYYRLNVVPLTLPPLRKRGEDVILLADHFLKQYARKHGRKPIRLTREHARKLTAYDWPGNIRELQNVMERAVILSTGGDIMAPLPARTKELGRPDLFADTPTLDEVQRRYIRHVLHQTRGKRSGPGGAADVLGMKRQTLYARMRKLGLP